MESGWIQLIIALVGGTGLGGTVAGIYSARASAKTGQSGNEVEAAKAATADWDAFMARNTEAMRLQEERLVRLEAKVQHLEAEMDIDAVWIEALREHIWLGKQPPPPPRPKNPR